MLRRSAICLPCPRKSCRPPAWALAGRSRKAKLPRVRRLPPLSMQSVLPTTTSMLRSMLMIVDARRRALTAFSAILSALAGKIFTDGRKTRRGNTRCRCALTLGLSSDRRILGWIRARSGFSNSEDENSVGFSFAFKLIAGLAQQVRNIDGRERIRAFRHDQVSGLQRRQFLAHPQRRQRTLQTAQVHGCFSHSRYGHAVSGTMD